MSLLASSEQLRDLPLTCGKEEWRWNHPTKKLSDGKSPSVMFCNDWVIRWRGGVVLGQASTRPAAILEAEENLKAPFWQNLVKLSQEQEEAA
jgi:hypothetical protein